MGWTYKNSNYDFVTNDQILSDTSAGPLTFTLPSSPSPGNSVEVLDATDSWAAHNLTIARNGSNIASSSSDLVCDINGQDLLLAYVNSMIGWTVVAQ